MAYHSLTSKDFIGTSTLSTVRTLVRPELQTQNIIIPVMHTVSKLIFVETFLGLKERDSPMCANRTSAIDVQKYLLGSSFSMLIHVIQQTIERHTEQMITSTQYVLSKTLRKDNQSVELFGSCTYSLYSDTKNWLKSPQSEWENKNR